MGAAADESFLENTFGSQTAGYVIVASMIGLCGCFVLLAGYIFVASRPDDMAKRHIAMAAIGTTTPSKDAENNKVGHRALRACCSRPPSGQA